MNGRIDYGLYHNDVQQRPDRMVDDVDEARARDEQETRPLQPRRQRHHQTLESGSMRSPFTPPHRTLDHYTRASTLLCFFFELFTPPVQ